MNIRKQNADDHTVMGYASYCACSLAVTLCSCSTTPCYCVCISPYDADNTASTGQLVYNKYNSDLKILSSNSAESMATH